MYVHMYVCKQALLTVYLSRTSKQSWLFGPPLVGLVFPNAAANR